MTSAPRLYAAADEAPAVWAERSPGARLVQALLDDLRLERPGRAPQHHLVLGPSGAGKSAALGRLAEAVRGDPALASAWVPVVLTGPHLDLAGADDLWRAALGGLRRALGASGPGAESALWGDGRGDGRDDGRDDGRGEGAKTEDSGPRQAVSAALRGAGARRLLLLVDEVDAVFERLTAAGDEWALRESVSHGRDVLLVVTSARPLAATYEYERAFYDFFRVRELGPLGEAEALSLAGVLAARGGRARPLDATNAARVAALGLLCGRTPRAVIRAAAATVDTAASAASAAKVRPAEELGRYLDAATPEVRAALDRLPAQGQRVVSALAGGWAAQTARQVAQATGLGVNAASAQLNRLGQRGAVERVALPHTKRQGFLLADRVVNLWLLWRRGGPGRDALWRLMAEAVMVCRPWSPVPTGMVGVGGEAPEGALDALGRALGSRSRDPWAGSVWSAAAPLLGALVATGRGEEAAAVVRASRRGAAWDVVAQALELSAREDRASLVGPGDSARAGRASQLASEPPERAAVVRRALLALAPTSTQTT